MWARKALLLAISSVLPAGLVRGQENPRRIVEIVHAEELSGQTVGGLTYRKLIGRVEIRQEELQLRCDSALQIVEREEIHLFGRIQIAQPTDTLWARRITYYHGRRVAEVAGPLRYSDGVTRIQSQGARYDYRQKRLELTGPLHLEDTSFAIQAQQALYETEAKRALLTGSVALWGWRDSLQVRADTLEYWRKLDRARASGGVFGRDLRQRVYFQGPQLWVDRKSRRLRADGAPLWARLQAGSRPDTLGLRAHWVEAVELDSLRQRLEAAEGLELVSRRMAARAAHLKGLRHRQKTGTRDSLWLFGRPQIWLERTWLAADSIWIGAREGELDSAWLHGQAVLLEEDTASGRYHQARASRIRAVFQDSLLVALELLEGAEVLYFLRQDTTRNGAVEIRARQITLRFSDGRLSEVRIPGSSEGVFYPEEALRNGLPSLPGLPRRPDPRPGWRIWVREDRLEVRQAEPPSSLNIRRAQ
ncbi:MAG: hypothetical protein N2561_08125 [Bacteroidetes bacterium]|nr:hypothetical protein [Rhodothermia bacterium]MCS7155426.1 hypothetical protein [Bacteroidota bacterium]MCX7907481.1 hypothetical protein [Bacteroidota bacterium]MDW8138475.1 OstA-like protein [Bacteroidota bacterium]MDW8284588.1 OstA-like protein [Bacteroidota bacterium]